MFQRYCCHWSDTCSNAWWQAKSPSLNPTQLPGSFSSFTSTLLWLITASVNRNLNNNSQICVILRDGQHLWSFLSIGKTARDRLHPAIAPSKRSVLHSSVVVSSGLLHVVRNSCCWRSRNKTEEIILSSSQRITENVFLKKDGAIWNMTSLSYMTIITDINPTFHA